MPAATGVTHLAAAGILRTAARHMADAAAAVRDPLVVPLERELAERLPHARRVPAQGDPLHGAVLIAAALVNGTLTLPLDRTMLHVVTAPGDPRRPQRPVDPPGDKSP